MTTTTIEREAKLFEAGSYPDRGIDITEEDLDRIIENSAGAPVRIEHTSTPFDGALGVLQSVYRKGKQLFGRLCFTKAAWELIRAAGAKRLSVAISRDKSAIKEVSLVREPRVADAAVFSEPGVIVASDLEIDLQSEPVFSDRTDVPADEVERLRSELADRDVQSKIDELKRAGKITPACEVFARAILRSGDDSLITFGDRPTPINEVFTRFLDAMPRVIEFSELATADGTEPEEPEVFAKLGVTSRMVEKHRSR